MEVLGKGRVSRTAATSRVSKGSSVYGHPVVRAPGNVPDVFTPPLQVCSIFSINTPCMESMLKTLSQPPVLWVLPFLLSAQLLLCLLDFLGFGIAAGCSSGTLFCPLPFSVLLWALLLLVVVICISLDSYPLINSQFRMFILLFQWSQGCPVSRKQLLFIPLDTAYIAIFQNNFTMCYVSLSGCFDKNNLKIIVAS